MIRAVAVRPQGAINVAAADCVVLEQSERRRRRIALLGEKGTEFLLDLPEAVSLRNGDALVLENGALIEVRAAPEPLAEISAADPTDLARIAWHLGNRHLEIEIVSAKTMRMRRDPVVEEMLRARGAEVIELCAPFEPEGGAYEPMPARPDHADGHRHPHQSSFDDQR